MINYTFDKKKKKSKYIYIIINIRVLKLYNIVIILYKNVKL